MTQAALARAAGISQGALARIEVGDRSPTAGTLAVLAAALGVRLPDLFVDAPARANPAKSEKAWFRVCARLRDRDEPFLRAVERVIQALEDVRGNGRA